jgi:hypothetical protein
MTSGITRDIDAGKNAIDAVNDSGLVGQKLARLGLNERQLEMCRYMAYFRAQQYDDCGVAWDGSKATNTVERAAIVAASATPEGYVDLAKQMSDLPLRYRKPSAPCQLGRVIVSRFTSLLFSEQQSPQWRVPGDPATEAWVQQISKAYGLWSEMVIVRDLGGASGTAIVGFKIVRGEVVFETIDARWAFPTFDPNGSMDLVKLEVRYMFPKEELDRQTGAWETKSYWYRRIISQTDDCLWVPQPVGDGEEPNWEDPSTVASLVHHGLGVVSYRWIQNIRVLDDMDGDPDCHGCFDYFDRISELDSQSNTGACRNADPTPVVGSDGQLDQVRMGSKQALKLEKGGTLSYAESTGSSVETAQKVADRFQEKALQAAECVLPEEAAKDGGAMTATEINKRTAAMYAKASRLRSQYGERGVVPLMKMLLKAARTLASGRLSQEGELDAAGNQIQSGTIVRSPIVLPPKIENGKPVALNLGTAKDATLELVWPPFSQTSAQDTAQKVTSSVQARAGRIVTLDTAVRYVSPDFNIDDPQAEVKALMSEPAPDFAAQSLQELQEGR